jgi:hypothetical protein
LQLIGGVDALYAFDGSSWERQAYYEGYSGNGDEVAFGSLLSAYGVSYTLLDVAIVG